MNAWRFSGRIIVGVGSRSKPTVATRPPGRAGLRQAANDRAQLMTKLARLDKLDGELLRIVKDQERILPLLKEAARTLWTETTPLGLPISF